MDEKERTRIMNLIHEELDALGYMEGNSGVVRHSTDYIMTIIDEAYNKGLEDGNYQNRGMSGA